VDLLDTVSLENSIQADDIVINAAGYADATDNSRRGRKLFKQVNIEGVRNLVRACDAVRARQLIHISSVAAMGRWTGEMIEEHMMRTPESPYAQSKVESENILKAFKGRLAITILRPTSVFGEGRGLAKTLCKLIDRKFVPIPGGGKARIPFTYIGNVVKCVEISLDNPACFNQTFIIGDIESYLFKDIILCLAAGLDRRPVLVPVPRSIAFFIAFLFEISARILGFKPMIDRHRLITLCASVSYSIRAFQEATDYVQEVSMPEAARRIGEWYLGQINIKPAH
jgi:nucleoside-diphosphate-sugar epimerase